MKGRTVRIYLVDGNPAGVMTAEIMNWTGKFTVAPRSQLVDLMARPEIRRTGVYVLVSSNRHDFEKETVYIGESDNIRTRLQYHNTDNSKEFWDRTVVITSKDENLTKAHVRYLESRLIQLVADAKRAKLQNGTAPELPSLPEPDVADMEYFLAQVQMVLPVLGFDFAKSVATDEVDDMQAGVPKPPRFRLTSVGVEALAEEVGAELIVQKESSVRKHETPTLGDSYRKARAQMLEEGILIEGHNPHYWVFAQNYPFSSPSTAASIVCGATLNGRIHWKVEGINQTYADWQEAKVAAVAGTPDSTDE